MTAPTENWLVADAPHIKSGMVPAFVSLAMHMALRAVDRDIELSGAVTEETVNLVRAARGLYRIYT